MSFQSTPVRTRSQTRSRLTSSSSYTKPVTRSAARALSNEEDIASSQQLQGGSTGRRRRAYASIRPPIHPPKLRYVSPINSSISTSSVFPRDGPTLPSPILGLADRSPHAATPPSSPISEGQASVAVSQTASEFDSAYHRPQIQREPESQEEALESLNPTPLSANGESAANDPDFAMPAPSPSPAPNDWLWSDSHCKTILAAVAVGRSIRFRDVLLFFRRCYKCRSLHPTKYTSSHKRECSPKEVQQRDNSYESSMDLVFDMGSPVGVPLVSFQRFLKACKGCCALRHRKTRTTHICDLTV